MNGAGGQIHACSKKWPGCASRCAIPTSAPGSGCAAPEHARRLRPASQQCRVSRLSRLLRRWLLHYVQRWLPRRDLADDPYAMWLQFAIANMTDRGNYPLMDRAIAAMPPAPVLEIGCWAGMTSCLLARYQRKHGRREPIFAVDPWIFERRPYFDRIEHIPVSGLQYQEFIAESYRRNLEFFCADQLPHTFRMTSDEFFLAWEQQQRLTDLFGREVQLGGPLGYAYIDGDHSLPQAERDYGNCDRWLLPGGFLFFDDSADDSVWEVARLMPRVQAEGGYELVAKNPHYLWRKRGWKSHA